MNRLLNISSYIILLLAATLTLITIFRGLILNDEGYIINTAQRILNGQIIYRDFPFAYTPASAYLTALNFTILGNSLFSLRIGTLILTIITSILIFLLAKKITKKNPLTLLSILVYLAWGPTHINFPWPIMHAIPIGLAICLYFIKTLEPKTTKHHKSVIPADAGIQKIPITFYLFTAGILTTILLLFKQNFGGGVLLICLSLILYYKQLRTRRHIISYITGLITVCGLYTIYLLATNSLIPFLNIMYQYTIERIILEKSLDTPFFYGNSLIQIIPKALFYLFPFYISLIPLILLIRQKSNLIIIPLFTIIFYLLGIRPTTDYVHLVPLLAITGLPLLQLLTISKNNSHKNIINAIFMILILAGFYTAFFTGYYRWQKPLIQHTIYSTDEKIKLWLSQDTAAELTQIKSAVNKYTQGREDLFVYDYQPLIYYLTNKQNPTKFDLLAHNNYFLKEMPQVARTLTRKKVKLIITNKFIDHDKTSLAKYIRKNYKRVGESEHFYFWQNKPSTNS